MVGGILIAWWLRRLQPRTAAILLVLLGVTLLANEAVDLADGQTAFKTIVDLASWCLGGAVGWHALGPATSARVSPARAPRG